MMNKTVFSNQTVLIFQIDHILYFYVSLFRIVSISKPAGKPWHTLSVVNTDP